MKRTLLIAVIILIAITGCKLGNLGFSTTNPGDLPPVTTILSAYAVPDTIAPGDTSLFVCNISDSTDSTFKFYWYMTSAGTYLGGRDTTFEGNKTFYTTENHIQWKAPGKPYNYVTIEVTVANGSNDAVPVDKVFDVTVN
jgi:hypothetical protein